MKKYTILVILATLLISSCTENQRSRSFGGTSTVDIPQGQKLVNVTWKYDSLWVLTRQAKQGEMPETYTFQENSSFGIMEGVVIIKER